MKQGKRWRMYTRPNYDSASAAAYAQIVVQADSEGRFDAPRTVQLAKALIERDRQLKELRKLAKAVLEPWEPEWDTLSRKALRAVLKEQT